MGYGVSARFLLNVFPLYKRISMSKILKTSIVLSVIYVIASVMILYNWVYIEYNYTLDSNFWLVFIRSVAFVTVLPLVFIWGGWWIFKK